MVHAQRDHAPQAVAIGRQDRGPCRLVTRDGALEPCLLVRRIGLPVGAGLHTLKDCRPGPIRDRKKGKFTKPVGGPHRFAMAEGRFNGRQAELITSASCKLLALAPARSQAKERQSIAVGTRYLARREPRRRRVRARLRPSWHRHSARTEARPPERSQGSPREAESSGGTADRVLTAPRPILRATRARTRRLAFPRGHPPEPPRPRRGIGPALRTNRAVPADQDTHLRTKTPTSGADRDTHLRRGVLPERPTDRDARHPHSEAGIFWV
jgi:hypothetical protein